jgi:sulfur relay (sulfurtransferase) DsrC/TusE family protein
MQCFDPKISRTICLESKNYLLNDRFYLQDFFSWDVNIRDWLASREDLQLQEEHHHTIEFLRQYYSQKKCIQSFELLHLNCRTASAKKKVPLNIFTLSFPAEFTRLFLLPACR